MLGVPPLQDWTEVRAGKGEAHALTALCRWGPWHLDRAWDWLWRCVPGRWHPRHSGCPEVPWRKMEEEMDTVGSNDTDQAQDWTHRDIHPASAPCSVCRWVESDSQPNGITKTTIWRKDTLLKWMACLFGAPPNHTSFYSRTRNTQPVLLGGAPPCLKLVFFIGLVL